MSPFYHVGHAPCVRVLVAGASGFVGRSVVGALARAGHEVRGLVRSRERGEVVAREGGLPVIGDVKDVSSLERAAAGCELLVHLASARGADTPELTEVRVRGAAHLVAAAVRQRVRRILVGSGYWVYRDNPGEVTEESPLEPMAISRINHETEEVVRSAAAQGELEAVVLRPGMIYGDGSWFGEMVDELRAGTYRYVAPGRNYLSPVDWEDAGEAFRVVAEAWPAGRTFLVVDDEPVTTRGFAEYVARELGVPPPTSLPLADAVRDWGEEIARLNAASRRASNRRLRALGWVPRHPTYREGIPRYLGRRGAR